MAYNTIAFALNGEVPMPAFDHATHHWTRLITALTQNFTKRNQVLWYMDESPSLGSSQSVRGEAEGPEIVDAIVQGYESVAKAVQTNKQVPYSLRVRQHANGLVNVLTITE